MRERFKRILGKNFREIYFKPRGIPLRELGEIVITAEEMETLRLRFIRKLTQEESAKIMGISQSQYQRDITHALEKITQALIEGYALNIGKTQV